MTSRHIQGRSYLFITISTCVVLLGGMLTALWQFEHQGTSSADAGDVVGPPSLPAATVDAIFARMGSPMEGTGQVVEQAARNANIDDAFALGVWYVETNDGAAGVGLGDRNPGSVRGTVGYPSAFDGYTIYPSYSAAITDWFTVLKNRYVDRGLTSVYTICHPYVGTSSAELWAGKVVNLMIRYRGEAPTPTPTPSPTPTPIPSYYTLHHAQIDAAGDSAAYPVVSKQNIKPQGVILYKSTVHPGNVQVASALAAGSQKYLIYFVLLFAFVMAGAGVALRLRKSELVTTPQTAPLITDILDKIVPEPGYDSEFSLLSQQSTAPLLAPVPRAPFPVTASALRPLATSGGLLSSYGQVNGRPRRVMLRAAVEEGEPAVVKNGAVNERATEGIVSYEMGISLAGWVSETGQISRGGLLHRFGDNAEKNQGENC